MGFMGPFFVLLHLVQRLNSAGRGIVEAVSIAISSYESARATAIRNHFVDSSSSIPTNDQGVTGVTLLLVVQSSPVALTSFGKIPNTQEIVALLTALILGQLYAVFGS